MGCWRCAVVCLLVSLSASAIRPSPVVAQEADGQVRRINGIIDQDQTWSGRIIVTDDLMIQDATVTITEGTTIEFAHKTPGHHPTLTVGSTSSAGGHLVLLGTAERPITFRTRPNTNAGRLVINVRSRIMPGRRASDPLNLGPPGRMPNDVAWQHVRFEDLGYVDAKQRGGWRSRPEEPAVTFNVISAAHTLGVVDCSFDDCARLVIRAADKARITVVANRFDHPKERACVEIFGREGDTPAGPIAVARNTLAGAIRMHAAPAMIMDNILIGLDAAMVIEEDTSEETKISGNYIHSTTDKDDGHYCLKCENPAALIEDNIFRGGTTCVWNGSRRMAGNVLIGAASLTSQVVKNARTHQLVQALPAGATFERNLLLGPAYSLLIPQPVPRVQKEDNPTSASIIRNNLFDGFSASNRAIHLNALGHAPATVAVMNNVFLRIPTLVCDEAETGATLTYADHNAVAPPAPRAFDRVRISGVERGEPGWAAKDLEYQDVASLHLTAVPPQRIPDYDADLLAGKISVRRVRQRMLNTYRPSAHSPLVHAGRPQPAGSSEFPPSIGPLEPTNSHSN
ncbi:MAG: hypothetical protein JXQ75_18965 [Phycisphaerae bacterium]|nr:hypothetical protein [Phycisphaerae bacterium]